ncbi:hypothetical protein Taro_014894 [Colocasia esculenta]|uniref:Leucine-rich repeat-containing N-terminal plant-type domain-containing protein n=1 Tax=Colocasia esculenta TaxID=4460 RepID=A0A843UJZ5_COLES|nr:hypothetical protein [Colocasia esculenta]
MEEERFFLMKKWRRQVRALDSPSAFSFFLIVSSVLGFPARGVGMLNPVDFLALQSVRKALDDTPGSRFFASWDFTADPCRFSGVFCAGDRVVALSLGDPRAGSPGLSGSLHPAVGRLSALAELSIVPGRVVGPLPSTLAGLANLRFLAISRNFLSGAIPPGIAALRQLRTVDLSFNQLSGAIPPGLAGLPALANVILCHNRFSGGVPLFYSPFLARLDLSHNDLSSGVAVLPPSLQYLSLSWNRLTGSVDRVLPRLVRLNYLDLSLNRFTGPIPPGVFSLPLATLQLQRNQFSGPLRPATEVAIPAVDVSYNQFSGEVSPLFAPARRLYMNNNRFTGRVPATLVARLLEGAIEVLYLQHNYLTGVQIDPAAGIPRGSSLCLQYNCMVSPPVQMACPLKAGREKSRPSAQCTGRRG